MLLMSLFRKLSSACGLLLRGEFVKFFNAATAFLHLRSLLFIGDTLFYTIEPFNDRPIEPAPTVPILCETDPDWTDRLLACMEGTTDYSFLKPENRREKFETYFHLGSRVWLALDGETVAGFIWETPNVYFAPHGKTLIRMELPPNTAFLEFMFVNENYRRRRIHTQLLAAARRASPDVRFSCLIAEDNAASRQSHEKFGFRRSGRVLHFHCFGLVFASFRFEKTRKLFFRLRPNIPYTIKIAPR